jgi:hypothetical protein
MQQAFGKYRMRYFHLARGLYPQSLMQLKKLVSTQMGTFVRSKGSSSRKHIATETLPILRCLVCLTAETLRPLNVRGNYRAQGFKNKLLPIG